LEYDETAPQGPASEKSDRAARVGLVALEYGMCRFPRDGGAGVEFCGAPVFPGSSWCKEHHRLCHSREKSRVSFVLPRLSAS